MQRLHWKCILCTQVCLSESEQECVWTLSKDANDNQDDLGCLCNAECLRALKNINYIYHHWFEQRQLPKKHRWEGMSSHQGCGWTYISGAFSFQTFLSSVNILHLLHFDNLLIICIFTQIIRFPWAIQCILRSGTNVEGPEMIALGKRGLLGTF